MFSLKFFKFLFWTLYTEIFLLLVLISQDYVADLIANEGVLTENILGTETLNILDRDASVLVYNLFFDSNLYQLTWDMLTPDHNVSDLDERVFSITKPVFAWCEQRLDTLMYVFFLLFWRIDLMLKWLLLSLIVMILGFSTGWIKRKIKQSNFDFASPTAHRAGLKGMLLILLTWPLILLLPIPIHPLSYPILFGLVGVTIAASISNIAKRI